MSLTPAARLCWWSESRHRLILRASRRPVRRRWRGRSTAPRWARVPPPSEAAVTAAVAQVRCLPLSHRIFPSCLGNASDRYRSPGEEMNLSLMKTEIGLASMYMPVRCMSWI